MPCARMALAVWIDRKSASGVTFARRKDLKVPSIADVNPLTPAQQGGIPPLVEQSWLPFAGLKNATVVPVSLPPKFRRVALPPQFSVSWIIFAKPSVKKTAT